METECFQQRKTGFEASVETTSNRETRRHRRDVRSLLNRWINCWMLMNVTTGFSPTSSNATQSGVATPRHSYSWACRSLLQLPPVLVRSLRPSTRRNHGKHCWMTLVSFYRGEPLKLSFYTRVHRWWKFIFNSESETPFERVLLPDRGFLRTRGRFETAKTRNGKF